MPELPEVETIARQLNSILEGKKVKSVTVFRAKSFQGDPELLQDLEVKAIKRVAKVLVILFSKQFPQVLVHLKMTGQLIYVDDKKRVAGGHPSPDWIAALPNTHTRVVITFTDNSTLYFNDMRVFGWLKLIENQTALNKELKGFKGIEPLTSQFTSQILKQQMGKLKRPIKIALMDQALIAGVGNIYANDALWDAGIDPQRPAATLTDKEWDTLCKSINKVIELGIRYGGASERDFKHADGKQGTYQKHFLVYKKEGTSCSRCQHEIKKIRLGGRGTYFCPYCQK